MILCKMNLVLVLEIFDRIICNEVVDLFGFFQVFSKGVYFFLFNGDLDRKFDLQIVFEIYIYIFIEKLVVDKINRFFFVIIVEVFCDGGDLEDYFEFFLYGLFVFLGESLEEVMIVDWIQEIVFFVKKRGCGVSEF